MDEQVSSEKIHFPPIYEVWRAEFIQSGSKDRATAKLEGENGQNNGHE